VHLLTTNRHLAEWAWTADAMMYTPSVSLRPGLRTARCVIAPCRLCCTTAQGCRQVSPCDGENARLDVVQEDSVADSCWRCTDMIALRT
jgi:hypothetical protein